MTKRIRIENADMSNHKVVVEIWERGVAPEEGAPVPPDSLVSSRPLNSPTEQIEATIWGNRYLVIREVQE